MDIRNLSSLHGVNQSFKGEGVKNTSLLKQDAPEDSAEFQHKANGNALSKEDKQAIVQSARTTASGWGVFGGIISTAYFGLRSDKTVAEKYDLDAEKDKDFIKQIKREQTIWTLASIIPGIGWVGGVAAWLYNKNADSSKIEVK